MFLDVDVILEPLVISQSKITAADKIVRKRALEESPDDELVEEENVSKKSRPTLLGINREKKISKYEKFNADTDEEDDDGEECEEEASEDEVHAEDDDDDDDDDNGEEEDVGEEIEEELMVIRCEGNGKECESSYIDFIKLDDSDNEEDPVGEAIEEDLMIIIGEGSGHDCLVGNSKESNKKESVCLVKESDCEKVSSVIKTSPSDVTNSAKNNKCSNVKTNLQEKDITPNSVADELTNGEKMTRSRVQLRKYKNITETSSLKTDTNIKNSSSVQKRCPSPNKKEDSVSVIKILEKMPSPTVAVVADAPEKIQVPKIKITEEVVKEIVEKTNSTESEKVIEESKVTINVPVVSKKDCCKLPEAESASSTSPTQVSLLTDKKDMKSSGGLNRKRRLSEERPRQNSESETDLNSEVVEEQQQHTEEEDLDVGGKRPKMRCKVINSSMRKKVEAERNYAVKESSSSEEDIPKKEDVNKKPSTKSLDKVENKECKPKDKLKEEEQSADLEKTMKDSKNTLDNKKDDEPDMTKIVKKTPPTKQEIPEREESVEKEEEEVVSQVQTRSGRRKSAAAIVQTPIQSKRRGKAVNVSGQKNGPKGKKAKADEKHDTTTNTTAIKEDTSKVQDQNTEEVVNGDKKHENCIESEPSKEDEVEDKTAILVEEAPKSPKLPVTNDNSNTTTPLNEEKDKKSPSTESKEKEVKKRTQRQNLEIDITNIIEADSDVTPVRQSRRIAQLKIREEAERRKLEEIALKKMKDELKKKKKEEKKNSKDETDVKLSSDSEKNESVDSEVEMKKKLDKKRRGIKLKKGGWSSGTDDDLDEEEEEFQYETDVGSPLFKSDHEFSPESDIEDESQIVPTKRARTARREGEEGAEIVVGSDEACQKCGKTDHPEWILLCDKCDKGYHCSCLSPVLFIIPEGDWFCPLCQQEQLIAALETQLKEFDDLILNYVL